jgi:putative FmdB family regulatory protein
MPIYAYRCEDCGHELDALQKISDAPLTDCPECGAAALKKQITAAAFRLKGAGWYETDFKKDGKKNLHETGEQPAAKAEKDGDAKADKPEKADTPTKKDTGAKVEAAPKSEPKTPPKPKPKPKETAAGS